MSAALPPVTSTAGRRSGPFQPWRSPRRHRWLSLTAALFLPLGSGLPALSQSKPVTTCDPATLSPLSVSGTTPSGSVDLGSLPGSTTATDLKAFPPPTTALTVPKQAAEVTIATTQPLTLEQALTLAQQRNRDLQIAALQVEQQRFALREAKAALYPTVSADASITRSDSARAAIAAKQAGLPNRPKASNDFDGSAQLNYDVFTSGQRPASIKAAEAALKSTEKAYQTQLRQLRLDVANDYYDLQQADESVKIAQQTVENAEENLRTTKARELAGVGTRFETLQAEVTLADQKQQLIQAQSQQQVSRRQLAQRLSLPETVTVVSTDPVTRLGEWTLSLEESIVKALQSRSELAQVLDQRNIALQNRRVALGSLGPQLTFSASVDLADDLTDDNLGAYGYGLGAQASKTIFDGGSAKAIANQQQISATIAETQFASFKNVIRFQVEQSFYTLKSSQDRILTTRCAIEQAEEGLRLAKLRQQFGVGTSLEVSNANTDLAQARNNYLAAIVSYNRALSSLQRFVVPPSSP